MKEGKISVIGIGNVGQETVMNLWEKRIGKQIYCFGRPGGRKERIDARLNEIMDSHEGLGPEFISCTEPKDVSDSDIVIITAGSSRKAEQTRDDLARGNARVVSEWSGYIKEYARDSVLVMVTNPSGPMTGVALDKTGFPRERVIGIGGSLDGKRVIREFSKYLGLSGSHMQVYILGDHGENMVIPKECFTIGGTSLERYLEGIGKADQMEELDKIAERMKKASQPLIEGLGRSPWLGPGEYISRMCEEIYWAPEDCKTGTTDSALVRLEGEYGIEGVAGAPVIVGRRGIIKVIKLPELSNKHREELEYAAKHIRKITENVLYEI